MMIKAIDYLTETPTAFGESVTLAILTRNSFGLTEIGIRSLPIADIEGKNSSAPKIMQGDSKFFLKVKEE